MSENRTVTLFVRKDTDIFVCFSGDDTIGCTERFSSRSDRRRVDELSANAIIRTGVKWTSQADAARAIKWLDNLLCKRGRDGIESLNLRIDEFE